MGKKDSNKPRGKMSSYAFFVQTCREEHKKKHPGEQVVFSEFSRKCAEKWKAMGGREKKRFEDMAAKDKTRYDREMSDYVPGPDDKKGRKRKQKKDPNAPKRALSAFFFFCAEQRPEVRKAHPGYSVGDVAKEMGKRWEGCHNKTKYEQQAKADKERYAKEMAHYKPGAAAGGASAAKKAKVAKPAKKAPVEEEEEESEEEDDDDEEDDDTDDDEDEDDE